MVSLVASSLFCRLSAFAGYLHCLHSNRFRAPRPVRRDRRPQPWPLVRAGLEQGHGTD